MNAVMSYLQIVPDDENYPVWLSWSAAGDALERPDGTTFAFAGQIALFLEGYALIGPLIHFSYVLTLLEWLQSKGDEPLRSVAPIPEGSLLPDERLRGLARAFQAAGKPHRNAGALCAWLCREVPRMVDPPDSLEVCLRLIHGSVSPVFRFSTTTYDLVPLAAYTSPPLSPLQFQKLFLAELEKLSPEEINGWLEHGRALFPFSGQPVAETIEALRPRTLDSILDALEERDRLAGASPMVAQFLSALSLPPRHLAYQALPNGGYSDVATRGRPEQILPSQFAIDNIEFLRRFAENELLYFHREEPHAPLTEELVLLIDQGVRTWGKVRPALAASALALARLSVRKKVRLLLTTTGMDGKLVDPLTVDEPALGTLWEASDLSLNPSRTVQQVLGVPGEVRRDLIVLTHPRSTAGEDFAAATRRADDSTRVFTVAIEEPGAVQFREWRRGIALKVADFRVDFSPPSSRKKSPHAPTGDPRSWRGDVEPVPFPFRLGVTQRIDRPLFDFDAAGRWFLLCTHRGMLHAWKLDGSAAEVLPRAVVDGSILEQVDAVLGVAEGFVVAGRVGQSLVAMHYDFSSKTARAYALGPTFDQTWAWFYFRGLHTVVARGKDYSRAVDLSNREIHRSRESQQRPSIRAIQAFEMAANHELSPPWIPAAREGSVPEKGAYVQLDRATGEIHLERVVPRWPRILPRFDGRPTLKDGWIDTAQYRGNVLALVVSHPDQRSILRLFQTHLPGDGGEPLIVIREFPANSVESSSLMLSHDGRLIARKLGERQVEIRETGGTGHPVFVTVKGRSHSDPKVKLGRYGLIIHVGKHVSLIRWDRDKLMVSTVAEGSTRSEQDVVTWPLDRPATRSTPLPKALAYDPHRFVACARAELTAVVDVFGQVSLFDRREHLIAMFVAFRSQVAAWVPDGTRFGPSQGTAPLIDGPATRNAAEIIGRVLREASDAALSSVSDPSLSGHPIIR